MQARIMWMLALVACGKETTPGSKPVANAVPAMAGNDHGVNVCERLVPREVRNGMSITGGGVAGMLTCNGKRDAKLVMSVSIQCQQGWTLDQFDANRAPGAADVAGIGRRAYKTASVINDLAFYAAQVECAVTVMGFDASIDLVPIAKATDAALTPTSAPLPAVDNSPPALRCDDFTPASVRTKLGATRRTKQEKTGGHLHCEYHGKNAALWVKLDCDTADRAKRRLADARDGQRSLGRYRREVDVGGGGFQEAGNEVTFLDPDTSCVVGVAASSSAADLLAIAREVEAAITPSSIKP